MNELQIKPANQEFGRIAPLRLSGIGDGPESGDGLVVQHLPELKALVVTKQGAGFTPRAIAALAGTVRSAADGSLPLNYLVFDFHHAGSAGAEQAPGYPDLLQAVSDLILEAPVVSVAVARGEMAGVDLELALSCSMMIADAASRFAFDGGLGLSTGLYRILAHKLGFVRAERLIETDGLVEPGRLADLLLLKEVLPARSGLAGIEDFLRRMSRRHNSSCGIYRAQRIATPTMSERLGLVSREFARAVR